MYYINLNVTVPHSIFLLQYDLLQLGVQTNMVERSSLDMPGADAYVGEYATSHGLLKQFLARLRIMQQKENDLKWTLSQNKSGFYESFFGGPKAR